VERRKEEVIPGGIDTRLVVGALGVRRRQGLARAFCLVEELLAMVLRAQLVKNDPLLSFTSTVRFTMPPHSTGEGGCCLSPRAIWPPRSPEGQERMRRPWERNSRIRRFDDVDGIQIRAFPETRSGVTATNAIPTGRPPGQSSTRGDRRSRHK
jgi:hypothetical protein